MSSGPIEQAPSQVRPLPAPFPSRSQGPLDRAVPWPPLHWFDERRAALDDDDDTDDDLSNLLLLQCSCWMELQKTRTPRGRQGSGISLAAAKVREAWSSDSSESLRRERPLAHAVRLNGG